MIVELCCTTRTGVSHRACTALPGPSGEDFAWLYRLAQRAGGVSEESDHIAQAFRPVLPQMLSTLSIKANQAPDVRYLPLILSLT